MKKTSRCWTPLAVTLAVGLGTVARGQEEATPTSYPATIVGKDFDAALFADPSRIVLGEVKRVMFSVVAPEPPGPLRPLRASVNVGSLGEVERQGEGKYQIAYRPPKKKYPQVAIVAIWRETGPDAPVAFFRVPLLGRAKVPVTTSRNARVSVDVDGETFGPFKANARGRAQLLLVVPPGVTTAKITAVRGKKTETADLALPVPPYNRLTQAVVPHAIIADGVSRARVHVYYDTVGARRIKSSDVSVTAAVGDVAPMRRNKGPVFSTTYTAPPGTPDQVVEFVASIANDDKSRATASVSLGRQVAASVKLVLSHERLLANGKERASLDIIVLDRLGLGVPGADLDVKVEPVVEVKGGTLGKMKSVRQGQYRVWIMPARLDHERRDPVRVEVTVGVDEVVAKGSFFLDPWLPAKLELGPSEVRLAADGRAVAVLEAKVTDAAGQPMPGFVPKAWASKGTVFPVIAAGAGTYTIRYRAPLTEQVVHATEDAAAMIENDSVVVTVGGLVATTAVLLSPELRIEGQYVAYLEVLGGYQTNLAALGGARLGLNAGVNFLGGRRVLATLGVWSGYTSRNGNLSFLNDRGTTANASVKVESWPVLGEVRLNVRGSRWFASLGGGAGVLVMRALVGVPGTDGIEIDRTIFAFGARLTLGLEVGAGKIVLDVTWLEAQRRTATGSVDVTGQIGGGAAGLGYRIEL